MHVFEVMTRRVFSCRPQDTLAAAAAAMWDHDVGCLPVVGDEDTVIGMITDRDICMAAYTRAARLDEVPIASVMSRGLHVCAPHQSVSEAEEVMRGSIASGARPSSTSAAGCWGSSLSAISPGRPSRRNAASMARRSTRR